MKVIFVVIKTSCSSFEGEWVPFDENIKAFSREDSAKKFADDLTRLRTPEDLSRETTYSVESLVFED